MAGIGECLPMQCIRQDTVTLSASVFGQKQRNRDEEIGYAPGDAIALRQIWRANLEGRAY